MPRSPTGTAGWLSLALCYAAVAAGQPEAAPQPSAAPPPAAAAATAADLSNSAPTLTTINLNVKFPVCKRYVPTGSRIATQRCESPREITTAEQRAEYETIRRDLQEMRATQALREQARAQALAEALRRRTGP